MNGMHAVEDYIVSRYQMYVQVYFHPVSRGMEVILDHLLHRAKNYLKTLNLTMIYKPLCLYHSLKGTSPYKNI